MSGILDLYNKEKETSHSIQSQLDITNAKLLEEKEKNRIFEEKQNSLAFKTNNYMNEVLNNNIISKDKIKELKQLVHKTLDDNGITRAFQLVIDVYFDSVLEE